MNKKTQRRLQVIESLLPLLVSITIIGLMIIGFYYYNNIGTGSDELYILD